MSAPFIAVSAIVPSLILMWYFHRRDAYPEPPRVLWTTFGLGILTTVPVIIVAAPLDALVETLDSPLAYGFACAFLVAAIPEEIFKFLVLWRYSARHPSFDEPMDGVVYGVAASLGFATLENILYVSSGGAPVAILRAVTAVPGHAFLGAIMGYMVGRAKFDPARRALYLRRALIVPILLHGAYDTPLLATHRLDDAAPPDPIIVLLLLAFPLVLIGEGVWAVRAVKRLRAEQTQLPPLPSVPTPVDIAAAPTHVPLRQRLGAPAMPPLSPGPHPPTLSPSPPARPLGEEEVRARATTVSAPVTVPTLTLGGSKSTSAKFIAGAVVAVGAILASFGGAVVFGVILGTILGGVEADDRGALLLGTVIVGVPPLVLGGLLLVAGVRRLNRLSRTTRVGPTTATESRG